MNLVKTILNKAGLTLLRNTNKTRAFSSGLLNGALGHVVFREFPSAEGLRFLQIGANNGSVVDPVYPFITQYGWKGVCVEPMPAPFAELSKTYAPFPGVKTVNAAIAATNGPISLYTLKLRPGEGYTCPTVVSSFNREIPLNFMREKGIDADIEQVEVPGVTIHQLLDDHQITALDVLQIDAEGYDWPILQQWDFARIKPAVLNFEHAHMTPGELRECLDFLIRHEYKFIVGAENITAWIFRDRSMIQGSYGKLEVAPGG